MDLGFETIGNATVICHDGDPVLATDPWLTGSAYFGSWVLSHQVPDEQWDAVRRCRYLYISHGHPDHLSMESLEQLRDKEILLADHYGGRIARELREAGFTVRVLQDGVWTPLSARIRVASIADCNQDSMLFIRCGDDLVIDANDATDRGCGAFLRQSIADARRSFLLWLTGYGDADMIHVFDADEKLIAPAAAAKDPIGPAVAMVLEEFGIDHFVPFSSMHKYGRTDSAWANEFITPLEAHAEGFTSSRGDILPPFLRFDLQRDQITRIDPPANPDTLLPPEAFGDDWSERLAAEDVTALRDYFGAVTHLPRHFGFLQFRVGGEDHRLELNPAIERGITFAAPRNSLMTSVRYKVFDDMLIGNYMRTILHGEFERTGAAALYPHFTPFVTKLGDNGGAYTPEQIRAYFAGYRQRGFFQFTPNEDQQAMARAVADYLD